MVENPVVLSLFPNFRGFGYACIDMVGQSIIDSGIVTARPMRNDRIIKRIKRFIAFHTPTIILLRNADKTNTAKSNRLIELHALIEVLAKENNVTVYAYTREQIKDVFEVFGARSKIDVSKQLITWFKELEPIAPRIRKVWTDEDYHMGVFDAVALAITHQYLTN